jgi:O-antigen/teichoic acid export membrane protein
VSGALLGLGLTIGFLLTGLFVRRSFYVHRKPWLAAGTSLTFFAAVGGGLWIATRAHVLNGFTAFLIVAAAWLVAGGCFLQKLPFGRTREKFLDAEPLYWSEHWKYTRWVLVTAFVFQLTSQGYYWLVAAFLSVKDVAELRALYLIVGSADQILIALSYLVLPLLAAHFAAKRMDLLLSLWRRYAVAILGIMFLFALFLDIFGKALVHLLYRGKFDDVAPLLVTFSLLPLLMGIGNTISDAMRAAEKPRYVFYAYLASGATTFLAGIPLVIHFGLRGAVYGLLLSGTAYTGALSLAFALQVHGQTRPAVDPNLD